MTKNTEKTEVLQKNDQQITAGDLALMVKIIDAGSERGAWKGEELGTIGILRTKMAIIVQAIAPEENGTEVEEVKEVTTETNKRAGKKPAA